MAITNAEAIKFVNERIRVRSEQIRGLLHLLQDDRDTWMGGIKALVPNDPLQTLEDGRESQGVSRLSGQEINQIVARINELLVSLEATNAMDSLIKACVRPLNVQTLNT